MKCKQDALAEELVSEYTTTVDRNIRNNDIVASTLLRGYAKLGKSDKMMEIFKREFMFDTDDKENYKTLDVTTLNAVLEC
jgi:pentatricopeptide repeat protein